MSGYPNVSKIPDATTRLVVQRVFEQLAALTARLESLEAVDPPTAGVTSQAMQAYVSAQLSTFGKGLSTTVDLTTATALTFNRGSLTEVV